MDDSRVNARANRILHSAHLRFQRHAMRKDPDSQGLASEELRATRFRRDVPRWLEEQRLQQRLAVCSGLRPNFWKAYIQTLVYMSK